MKGFLIKTDNTGVFTLGNPKGGKSLGVIFLVDEKTMIIVILLNFDKHCVDIVAELADNFEAHRKQLVEN